MAARNDGWRRASFGIKTKRQPNGTWVVGYVNNDEAPGLGINQAGSQSWVVTHLASGLAVFSRFRLLPQAKAAALSFAALGDWTRDHETVFGDLALKSKVVECLGLKVRA